MIPINQPGFNGKLEVFFFRGSPVVADCFGAAGKNDS